MKKMVLHQPQETEGAKQGQRQDIPNGYRKIRKHASGGSDLQTGLLEEFTPLLTTAMDMNGAGARIQVSSVALRQAL